MNRLFVSAIAAAALAAAVTPALAQPFDGGRIAGSIGGREARIAARIDRGSRSGELTRPEAIRLRVQLERIERLERFYRRSNGLSAWERRDLERRLDRLSARVFTNKHDWQRR